MIHFPNNNAMNRSIICDIIVPLIITVAALPVMLIIIALVLICYGRPVFYYEQRTGLGGKAFTLYKLNTMKSQARDKITPIDIHARINKTKPAQDLRGPLFRLLRKYSLDELPQLWNVLKGDMAMVGPRPMPLMELRHRFGSDAQKIISVKPGLTGLWQVSGRNDLSPEERRRLELYYVRNCCFRMDIRIVLKTFKAVLSGHGAY